MKLIIGLGNPGRAYANSRHNIGFQCLDLFAHEHGISLTRRQAQARLGMGEVAGIKVTLAKPQTFVNRSGEAVSALARRLGLAAADLVVIYDDLDLPLGRIRIRERGSSGGHNGIKSIIAHLGSQDFPRIRVGIAPSPGNEEGPARERLRTPQYVLSDFTSEEKAVIKQVQLKVAEAIRCLLAEGIVAAMNRYNQASTVD